MIVKQKIFDIYIVPLEAVEHFCIWFRRHTEYHAAHRKTFSTRISFNTNNIILYFCQQKKV